ncbi:MAG: hypothetical protein U0Q16_38180 [Bryobacteraceae bacterium]
MISGAHMILYSKNAEADRTFFRDVLGFPAVDAGGGWLIFALPPSEIACHPDAEGGKREIHLMTEDVDAAVSGARSCVFAGAGFALGPLDASLVARGKSARVVSTEASALAARLTRQFAAK